MDEHVRDRGRRRALLAVLAGVLLLLPHVAVAASDPYRPQQWGISRVRAEQAWGTGRQGRGVVVAVVDSGVDLTHPDLRDNLLRRGGRVVGWDFVDGNDGGQVENCLQPNNCPQDEHGHGTMVAGVIAAVAGNGEGVVGTAPSARIMPVRVLDHSGQGDRADVDAGIRWAVDNGADVVNLSLESDGGGGGGGDGGLGLPLLRGSAPGQAVEYAWRNGVAVVAAAGNSSEGITDYPDGSPVLVVGATDRNDRVTGFSDTGRRDAVVAPGVGIVSTWCRRGTTVCDGATHTYGEATGTSFAAPFASGAVALLRASGLGPGAALQRLRSTARDVGPAGPDPRSGHGLIDIAAAVGAPSAAAAPPEPEPAPRRREPAAPSPEPTSVPRAAGRQGSAGSGPAPRPDPPSTPEPSPTATPGPTPAPSTAPPVASPPLTTAPEPPPDPVARGTLVLGLLLLVGGTSWDLLMRRHLR